MKTVDIILPLYKPTNVVFESIDSVLAQTYTNWQLFIIDDASKDGSLEKVKEKYGSFKSKIKYIKLENNLRAAGARNYAISKSDGDYIAFIDQDDVWAFNKLELQVNYFENHNIDALHGNVQLIDNDGNTIMHEKSEVENKSRIEIDWENLNNEELSRTILIKPNIRLISSMVTRDIFEKIGGFKEQFFGGEDNLFWVEIAYYGQIGFLDEVLFYRRVHKLNSGKVFKEARTKGKIEMMYYVKQNYPQLNSKMINKKLSNLLIRLTKKYLKNKDFNNTFSTVKQLIIFF